MSTAGAEYLNRYTRFIPYTHRVKTICRGRVFNLSINLLTINQYFGKTLSPAEAKAFIEQQADLTIEDPQNFQDLSFNDLSIQILNQSGPRRVFILFRMAYNQFISVLPMPA